MRRRFICAVLVVCLCLLCVTPAFAVQTVTVPDTDTGTTQETGYVHQEDSYRNPLYPESAADSTAATAPDSGPKLQAADEEFTSVEDAGAYVRECMTQRTETIRFLYQSPDNCSATLFQDVTDEALRHTGVPTEGDYLTYQYARIDRALTGRETDDAYHFSVTFTVYYYTTAEQEAVVDEQVQQVLEQLDVAQASDYAKVKAVYTWLCAHTTYDYAHLQDSTYTLKYTAYAALTDGTAVCQGYAVLLYRLLEELGVDCRILSGTGNGDVHGWNIARVGTSYYYLDSTWDAGQSSFRYFLRGETGFSNHTRSETYQAEAFVQAYPVSDTDFQPCTASHTYKTTVIDPTCTESGQTVTRCTNCGETQTEPIAPLGHTVQEVSAQPATPEQDGMISHWQCSRCSQRFADSAAAQPVTEEDCRIPQVQTVQLSADSYRYSGKNKTPTVTVLDSTGQVLTQGEDYTVIYPASRKTVGLHTVTVTLIGSYDGTAECTFTISPNRPSLKKLTARKKGLTAQWTKLTTQTDGYELQYSRNKSFSGAGSRSIVPNTTTSFRLTGLKSSQRYYVRLRTYKVVDGVRYTSSWSSVKSVKTK